MKLLLVCFVLTVGCKLVVDPIGQNQLSTGEPSSGLTVDAQNRLNQIETRVQKELLAAIEAKNKGAINSKIAELESVYHLQDNVRALDPDANKGLFSELKLSQADVKAMIDGIVDSDLGKFESYKELLLNESTRSSKLFDLIQLNEQGALKSSTVKEMKRALSEMGHNRSIINSKISHQEIRQGFQKVDALKGFLHDLPGLVDAAEALESGKIDPKSFRERVKANLHHNGPEQGFWKKLKGFALGNAEITKKLFDKTLYHVDTSKPASLDNMKYPGSGSVGGALHRLVDRMSQGTSGGARKIIAETKNFLPSTRAIAEMIFFNPDGTMEQLAETRRDISKNKVFSEQEKRVLVEKTRAMESRVQSYRQELQSRVINAAEIKKGLAAQDYVPEKIVMRGEAGTVEITNADQKGKISISEKHLVKMLERGSSLDLKLYSELTKPAIVDINLSKFNGISSHIESLGSVLDPMRSVSRQSANIENFVERSRLKATVNPKSKQGPQTSKLGNRYNNSSQRVASNQQAASQTRVLNTAELVRHQTIAESFSKKPTRGAVRQLRANLGERNITADPELKTHMAELERVSQQYEQSREKIKTGQGRSSSFVKQHRLILKRLSAARTKVVNRVRARAIPR
jgi:hypothetical protein